MPVRFPSSSRGISSSPATAVAFANQVVKVLLPSGGDDTTAIQAAVTAGRALGPGTFQFSDVIYGCPVGQGSQAPAPTILQAVGQYARIEHGGSFGTPPPQLGGRYGGLLVHGQDLAPYLKAPAAPTLSKAASGGTVAAGTYQAIVTLVNAQGETVGSASSSIALTGSTSTLTVAAPTPQGDASGWYAYVTQAGGSTYTRQQTAGSPSLLGSNLTLTSPPSSSGLAPPGANTAKATLFTSNIVNGLYFDLIVQNSAGDGAAVYGQNCLFHQCTFHGDVNGCVLDNGCGGNVFARCEYPGAANYDLIIRQTPPANLASAYSVPTNNTWRDCIVEGFGGTGVGGLHVLNGDNNLFDFCEFAANAPNDVVFNQGGAAVYPNFNLRTYFRDCGFSGGTNAAVISGPEAIYGEPVAIFQGDNTFGGAPRIVEWHSSSGIRQDGTFFDSGGTAAFYTPLENAPLACTRGVVDRAWTNTRVGKSSGYRPADIGLVASNFDPIAGSTYEAPTAGYIYLMKIFVPDTIRVTNIVAVVTAGGSGLTAGQCLAGIYNSQGTLVGQTANQATAWASTGLKAMPLTAPVTLTGVQSDTDDDVFYWVALLVNGTTPPYFAASGGAYITQELGAVAVPGAFHRYAYEGVGGRTSLLSLNGLAVGDAGFTGSIMWVGLS